MPRPSPRPNAWAWAWAGQTSGLGLSAPQPHATPFHLYLEVLRELMVLEGGWDSNTLEDAQAFLRIEPDEERNAGRMALMPLRLKSKGGRQHRLRPLPEMLVAALHWLLAVCDSRLFHYFWTNATESSRRGGGEAEGEQEEGEDPLPLVPTREESSVSHEEAALEEEEWLCRALTAVRSTWAEAYSGLVTRAARLDELREYVRLLLRERERRTLETTAAGLLDLLHTTTAVDASSLLTAQAWPVLPADEEWQVEAGEQLAKLAHVCAVRDELPRVRKCLLLFGEWAVVPAADEQLGLEDVQTSATDLASMLDARWEVTLHLWQHPSIHTGHAILTSLAQTWRLRMGSLGALVPTRKIRHPCERQLREAPATPA